MLNTFNKKWKWKLKLRLIKIYLLIFFPLMSLKNYLIKVYKILKNFLIVEF